MLGDKKSAKYYRAEAEKMAATWMETALNEDGTSNLAFDQPGTYSMKYNMNGGACTLHFMPYKNGSAVNMRFSIAQLAGARYGKYAEDLTQAAANILAKAAYNVNIDVEEFLKEENKVTATQAPTTQAPVAEVVSTPVAEAVPTPVPVAAAQPEPQYKHRFCTNCGTALIEGAAFCTNCGAKIG